MKTIKYISWFLGISMLLFGLLKFVDPFKGWYTVQITHSGFGKTAYTLGIMGEIISGTIIILVLIFQKAIPLKLFRLTLLISSFSVSVMMVVAIYVHLNPNVPAEVLPLKIKQPVIPIFFLTSSMVNMWLVLINHKRPYPIG